MAYKIDYERIPIPEGADLSKLNYKERRAHLLKLINKAGTPGIVSLTVMGKKYGVSHAQISHDMKALAEYVERILGRYSKFRTEAAFNKVVNDLLKGNNKDKAQAFKIIMDWNNWLFDLGVQKKMAQEIRDVTEETIEESYERFLKTKEKWTKK